ncbi:hypothetical protein HDU96_008826, partial [Phlyctochytrium bullatum]
MDIQSAPALSQGSTHATASTFLLSRTERKPTGAGAAPPLRPLPSAEIHDLTKISGEPADRYHQNPASLQTLGYVQKHLRR